jgi:hypothetical protein
MMNYKHFIKRLKCLDIPDTRKLQEIRLNSIGKTSTSEEFMKKHYPDKYNIPRILTMPEEELKQVYSLAIPLTFPMLDPIGYGNGCETHFFRWAGRFNGEGALHLTTEKNLNKLIKLFSKNNINIKLEESFGRILDAGRADPPGIVVPHSWKVEHYDPYQGFFNHQFIAFEERINACPYYTLEKETSHTSKEEHGYENSSISLHNKIKKETKISCCTAFYTPKYFNPEEFLPKLLKKYETNLNLNHSNYIESRSDKSKEKEISHSLELKLLSVGQPVEIYNPNWIDKDIDARVI